MCVCVCTVNINILSLKEAFKNNPCTKIIEIKYKSITPNCLIMAKNLLPIFNKTSICLSPKFNIS